MKPLLRAWGLLTGLLLLTRLAGAQDSLNITRVGELLNLWRAQDVVMIDSFVYTADPEYGLTVVDTRDVPRLRAHTVLPEVGVGCVRIVGDRAYVAGYANLSLGILDIADRAHPVWLNVPVGQGSTLYPSEIAVTAEAAYLFSGTSVGIYNIEHPEMPLWMGLQSTGVSVECVKPVRNELWGIASGLWGRFHTDAFAQPQWTIVDLLGVPRVWNFVLSDTVAFFAADTSGLLIASVATPQHPARLALLDIGGRAKQVALSGRYALVTYVDATTSETDVAVVDIANPRAPVLRSRYPWPGLLAVEGTQACLVDYGTLRLMEITNPLQPVERARYSPPRMPKQLADHDSLLFVVDRCYHCGMEVFSLADPAYPVAIEKTHDPACGPHPSALALEAPYVYVVSDQTDLQAYDLTDPYHLLCLGEFTYTFMDWSVRLLTKNQRLYAVGESQLLVFDVSNPAQIRLLGGCYHPASSTIATALYDNSVVYSTGGGLSMMTVVNPAAPLLIGTLPYPVRDLVIREHYLFALTYDASRNCGIQTFDLTNPLQPALVNSLILDHPSSVLRMSGSYLLAVDATGCGLSLITALDPANLQLAGFYHDSLGEGFDAVLRGDYVYVGTSRGLVVYDAGAAFHSSAAPEPPVPVSTAFALGECYPNPFNATTVIPFTLPREMRVSLRVYDVLGREAAVLVDGVRAAGPHERRFDAAELPSGLYFVSLQAAGFSAARKLLLVK